MNSRFEVVVNGSKTKLTLKPGQILHWKQFEKDEEGWSFVGWRFINEDDQIIWEQSFRGVDCDGRIAYDEDLVWDKESFSDETGLPIWR